MLPPGAIVIYETRHGSHAYGLATAESDLDVRGVFVPPLGDLIGFLDTPLQLEPSPERVLYEVRKLFRLAAACNPTVIEVLFTEASDHVAVTRAGERLLGARDAFLSRRAGESFGRYAVAQLKRIKTHRRWLLSPPLEKPARAAFGLPEKTTVSADQRGAAETLMQRGDLSDESLSPAFLDLLDRERRYRAALREWQQYEDWRANRNPRRAELERQFGYDTKHAMHLLRLLRMAREILSSGRVIVRRPDAEELLAVRQGALTFDALLAEAEGFGSELPGLAAGSALPAEPDEGFLNQLCGEVVELAHGEG